MNSVKDTNPGLYHEAKLEIFIDHWEAGKDHISRGAPCIIQAWAERRSGRRLRQSSMPFPIFN